MRSIHFRRLITIILISVFILQGCAFEYEPSIPPIDWGGGLTPQPMATLPPAVGPYDVTCEGDADLFYCRVPCTTGPNTRICYQLCVSDECSIYAMDNWEVAPRVDAFIRAIHNWQVQVKEYASKKRTAAFSVTGVGAACFTAIGSGLNAISRMGQQVPTTPEWLVPLGIFTFVVSAGGCVIAGGKSLFDSLSLPSIEKEAHKWLKDAVDNWSVLQSCQNCEE